MVSHSSCVHTHPYGKPLVLGLSGWSLALFSFVRTCRSEFLLCRPLRPPHSPVLFLFLLFCLPSCNENPQSFPGAPSCWAFFHPLFFHLWAGTRKPSSSIGIIDVDANLPKPGCDGAGLDCRGWLGAWGSHCGPYCGRFPVPPGGILLVMSMSSLSYLHHEWVCSYLTFM